MNHNIITCTGFGGTGSSVISDLMAEFKSVKGCGDFEWSMSSDIDGVSDLQHYIVDDFNAIKVTEGIYRFKRYTGIISRGYKRILGIDIQPIFDEYVNELIDFRWMGSNNMQVWRYGWVKRKWYGLVCKAKMFLSRILTSNEGYERGYQKPKMLLELSQGDSKFFDATRRMYGRLLDSLDETNQYNYLCFDRLVPPYTFKRYSKYFQNIKIVCVDRDPRDLFLLNALYWHEGWIPSDDIDTYIQWFRTIRNKFKRDLAEADPGTVMSVQFEDAIYNYDETIKKVIDFIGLDPADHVFKKKHFNPDYSIRNTKLWEKTEQYKEEILKIETELQEYCYKY